MRTSLVTREEMIEAMNSTLPVSVPGIYQALLPTTYDHQTTLPEKGQERGSPYPASDIREYLLEQGHLNYATVAAKHARRHTE